MNESYFLLLWAKTKNYCLMVFIFLWGFFAMIVGLIASDKAMGFWGGFLLSLLLSPVIGVIIVLFSKSKQTHIMEQRVINSLDHQPKPQQAPSLSVIQQLSELEDLKSKNLVTEEEYTRLRGKIMSSV
jgi:hypothetical protein